MEKFTDEKISDPRIISLMERVDATLVRELKFGAKVLVRMKDGKAYCGELKNPKAGFTLRRQAGARSGPRAPGRLLQQDIFIQAVYISNP